MYSNKQVKLLYKFVKFIRYFLPSKHTKQAIRLLYWVLVYEYSVLYTAWLAYSYLLVVYLLVEYKYSTRTVRTRTSTVDYLYIPVRSKPFLYE